MITTFAQSHRISLEHLCRNFRGIYLILHVTNTRSQSYCLRAAGQANPSPQNTDSVLHEAWKDTVSRSVLITTLILDDNPGQLAQMLEMTYPGHNPGGQPPMGHEVIAAAQRLKAGVTE